MDTPPGAAARDVRQWILGSGGPIRFTTERELQELLEHLLITDPPRAYITRREHSLDEHNRIDFLTCVQATPTTYVRVGIEVKIHSALAVVRRQLERYAESDYIDELLLVTTKAVHHRIPPELNGKPAVLCSLVEAGL